MSSGYAIVRKIRSLPPENYRVLTALPSDLDRYGPLCALDFETHGTDPTSGTIRSVAIANDYGTVAIDCEQLSKSDRIKLTQWLLKQDLIAHNAVFDAGWLYAKTGVMPKIEACTLVLFKLLATEGYLGQRWGLKLAMTDLLGWPESNEADLHAWLKSKKLFKKDMAQAPWDILGKYNAMDAAATWQLYKYFQTVIQDNGWEERVMKFQQVEFVNLMNLLIEQQIKGMTIDLKKLSDFDKKLEGLIKEKKSQFLSHPEVKPHVEYYQSLLIEEVAKTTPPKYKKTGKPKIINGIEIRGYTVRYIRWLEKLDDLNNRIDFNIDSPKQLQWLFYERLFYECPIKTDKGGASVGTKALPHLGELGILMKEYRAIRDRRKFVTALQNVQRDGMFYPSIKIHATISGRCGGGIEG